MAEACKAQIFFRGMCGFSCWYVIVDTFVVRAATCKGSKGGISTRSGPVRNG
jgi:hypothetical protein